MLRQLFIVILLFIARCYCCLELVTASFGCSHYDGCVLNITNVENNQFTQVADFLFEVGILAKTPRSGIYFLGGGDQSVAEHLNRTAYIGFVLGEITGRVDTSKIVQMCLFHDLLETRISDLNYVHQQYISVDTISVWDHILSPLPFGSVIQGLMDEYHVRSSEEAVIAKDADNLEWIMTLKEIYDVGNVRVLSTIENAQLRLQSPAAKQLMTAIMAGKSDAWYNNTRPKQWWVNRVR